MTRNSGTIDLVMLYKEPTISCSRGKFVSFGGESLKKIN
jgi:hypothetical protein